MKLFKQLLLVFRFAVLLQLTLAESGLLSDSLRAQTPQPAPEGFVDSVYWGVLPTVQNFCSNDTLKPKTCSLPPRDSLESNLTYTALPPGRFAGTIWGGPIQPPITNITNSRSYFIADHFVVSMGCQGITTLSMVFQSVKGGCFLFDGASNETPTSTMCELTLPQGWETKSEAEQAALAIDAANSNRYKCRTCRGCTTSCEMEPGKWYKNVINATYQAESLPCPPKDWPEGYLQFIVVDPGVQVRLVSLTATDNRTLV